jgi:hypothetical protein
VTASVERLETWLRREVPRLNRAVLYEGANPNLLAERLAADVLPELPVPDSLTRLQAQRLIIGLGLAGASIARHFQEVDPARKADPERSFDGLVVGDPLLPFPEYMAAVADQTGLGHYPRDTYASLVLWNVPTTEVRLNGETLAALPGVFEDGHIRSYTGDQGEQWFFELVKKGQTIEAAANDALEPISDGDIPLDDPDLPGRLRLAAQLLEGLRQLFLEFASPSLERGMQPRYFMDVFRQYAVHWRPDDIPPSGALDIDALKRDYLLGVNYPGYERHVEKLKPALLLGERTALTRLMNRPPLPVTVLRSYGVEADALAAMPDAAIHALVSANPVLVEWYLLMAAHARAAGAHLMLSKRFLFNPQRHRDEEGEGDKELVSNRKGTTGMDETFLDRLTRVRKAHVLAPLHRSPAVSAQLTRPEPPGDLEVVMVVGGVTIRADAGVADPLPPRSAPAQATDSTPGTTPASGKQVSTS